MQSDFNFDDYDMDAELSKLLQEEENNVFVDKTSLDTTVEQECRTVILFPCTSLKIMKSLLKYYGADLDIACVKDSKMVIGYMCSQIRVSALETLIDVSERQLPDGYEQTIKNASFAGDELGVIEVTAFINKIDVEDGDLGQMIARRYVKGEFDQNLPASVILSGFDIQIEELILGQITFDDLKKNSSSWLDIFRNEEE